MVPLPPLPVLSRRQIRGMRRAGRAAAGTLAVVGRALRPGMTTADLDALVRRDTRRRGGHPAQLGYQGFPAAVCTSVNDVVCHGIPSPAVVLQAGDIVNVDVTSRLGGLHGDTSETFFVGAPSPEARHVVETARRCRDAGIAAVRDGAPLNAIGAAVEAVARAAGCSVVREYGGHGIGVEMHLPPWVPHFDRGGDGPRVRAGMALTVEPMVNLGTAAVVEQADGWTVRTADGALSAQFEHTVLVTARGAEVLTRS